MLSIAQRAPERLLRTLILTGVVLASSLPLLLLSPRLAWWQDPRLGVALILFAGLATLQGELRPELADGWLAERVRRYAPAAVGLLLAAGLLFPTLGTWYVLWVFFFINAILLAFAFMARVRAVCLCVTTALGLGLVVLDDQAVWCLPVMGAAWLLVPALDRYARTRMRLYERPPAALPALAVACSLFFAVGVGAFGLATLALPPSTRDYEVLDLLAPRDAVGAGGPPTELPGLPGWELFLLLALAGVALYLGSALSDRRREASLAGGEPLKTGATSPVTIQSMRHIASAWPASPRKTLVEAYLAHLQRLDDLGQRCPPARTPLVHSRRVARRLPATAQEAASRLATLFGRARWAPAEVSDQEAEEARADAKSVEDALLPPSSTAVE